MALRPGPLCDSCGCTIVLRDDEEPKRTGVGLAVHASPDVCTQTRWALLQGRQYEQRKIADAYARFVRLLDQWREIE